MPINRRAFLAGLGAGGAVSGAQARAVFIVADPKDPVAGSAPARWAAARLEKTFKERRMDLRVAVSGPVEGVPANQPYFLLRRRDRP